jgi:hypothetical protein
MGKSSEDIFLRRWMGEEMAWAVCSTSRRGDGLVGGWRQAQVGEWVAVRLAWARGRVCVLCVVGVNVVNRLFVMRYQSKYCSKLLY